MPLPPSAHRVRARPSGHQETTEQAPYPAGAGSVRTTVPVALP